MASSPKNHWYALCITLVYKQEDTLMKTLLSILTLGLVSTLSFAQTCEVTWTNKKDCIDLSAINGTNVEVSANTTHIGIGGTTICPIKLSGTKSSSVMFVLDQSASMSYWGGTDYDGYRAKAIHNSIKYFKEHSNNSYFGYVEFGSNVEIPLTGNYYCDNNPNNSDKGSKNLIAQSFLPVNEENVSKWTDPSLSPIQNRCGSGTNYYQALKKTKQLINDFSKTNSNTEFSVVFVSDGDATVQSDSTWYPLNENFVVPGKFPKVHGVYVGGKIGSDLDKLVQKTGGTINLVNTSDTATVDKVMEKIINIITEIENPTSVVLKLAGKAYQANIVANAISEYEIQFPTNIPLNTTTNEIEISVEYTNTNTNAKTIKTTKFNLVKNTSDSRIVESPLNSLFNLQCKVPNSLMVNGIAKSTLNNFSLNNNAWLNSDTLKSLLITLQPEWYNAAKTGIEITSKRAGDKIQLSLSNPQLDRIFTGSTTVNYVANGYDGYPVQATSDDQNFQIAPFDTLNFKWINPNKASDSITATLLVYQMPKVKITVDTIDSLDLNIRVQDVGVTGSNVTVQLQWLGQSEVMAAQANRNVANWVFDGIISKEDLLPSLGAEYLIVRYIDEVFKHEFLDTLYIKSEETQAPVDTNEQIIELPIAFMQDKNGDGQADQMELVFKNKVNDTQKYSNFKAIWGNEKFTSIKNDTVNFTDEIIEKNTDGLGEKWIVRFSKPLTRGNTSGSGENGAGELIIQGKTIAVIDQVSPVLLAAWNDASSQTLIHVKVSEPIKGSISNDWITKKSHTHFGGQILGSVNAPIPSIQGLYSIDLKILKGNLLQNGDSIKITSYDISGLTDLSGNKTLKTNPWIVVTGNRNSLVTIESKIQEKMISNNTNMEIPPQWKSDEFSDVLRIVTAKTTGYKEVNSTVEVQKNISTVLPTFAIKVKAPRINGNDQFGLPKEGMTQNGSLVYVNRVKIEVFFYDQLGQFIAKKHAAVTFDQLEQVNEEGTIDFGLIWSRDPKNDLTDAKGRVLGTTPILAKILTIVESEAMQNVDVYNALGELSTESLKKGDIKVTMQENIVRFGYTRK